MPKLQLRRITAAVASAFLLSWSLTPAGVVFADDPASCPSAASASPGVHQPTGADASTYTYSCDTGLWTNPYYSYDPSTGETTPTYPKTYTYNETTGQYDVPYWTYSPGRSQWIQQIQSTSTPPLGANVVGGPTTVAPGSASISNTGADSSNSIQTTNNSGSSNISNTGSSSSNAISGTQNNSTNASNNTNATVKNTINGGATTGNALVLGNTSGGSAASGDAYNMANVINMLQSSSNALGGNAVTFVSNIDGNVYGDFMLDPNALSTIQPAQSANGIRNLTINNTTDATLNNNIDLSSTTGDATVQNNTQAGDAASGNAKAVANIVNLINSAVTSGKSFIGVVNINGNLNGDILLPPNFIDQLVAANVPTVSIDLTGPNSDNYINAGSGSSTTKISNFTNQNISNNVDMSALSGDASVSNNTSGGSAKTGSATNNITAFNLTGSQIIGSNAMLVFVNVMGSWVGMIVNAPAGTTAATLGGQITRNDAASTNTDIDNSVSHTINNNIKLASRSGDATVSSNTKGGNATTGNAQNGVNLANISNSSLAFTNWFGLLFINVFGNWNGSFGVNTSAGNPVEVGGRGGFDGPTGYANVSAGIAPHAMQVFGFTPRASQSTAVANAQANPTFAAVSTEVAKAMAKQNVLGAQSIQTAAKSRTPVTRSTNSIVKPSIIIGSMTAFFILLDAFNSYRKQRRHS